MHPGETKDNFCSRIFKKTIFSEKNKIVTTRNSTVSGQAVEFVRFVWLVFEIPPGPLAAMPLTPWIKGSHWHCGGEGALGIGFVGTCTSDADHGG